MRLHKARKVSSWIIVIVSISSTLFVLEIAARVYKREFTFKNFPAEKQELFRSAYPAAYDPELGWVPKEGFSGRRNIWKTKATILENGIRANEGNKGEVYSSGPQPILAVGDSFTFGDSVSDYETWPAVLEKLSARQVINAGVFGYGLDQIFLRAKRLIETYHPDTLIFSFIPSDIGRTECSERMGVSKPYFIAKDGQLVLKNTPAPLPEARSMDLFRRVFGYSFLAHYFMNKKFPAYWYQGGWHTTKAHYKGEEISCLILKELNNFAKINKVKDIYILVQYGNGDPTEETKAMVSRVISCVDSSLIKVVDLGPMLLQLMQSDRIKYNSFFKGHMTYQGNYFVAEQLWRAMQDG